MSLKVDIKKSFKGFKLHVSFETNNEYLGFLGASGSGKSMTLKCIAGVETPDEGSIVLNNRVLFDSEKKINLKPQDRNIGFLFQNYALFPNMTVVENIGAGLRLSKTEKKAVVNDMLKSFHLMGLENKYPNQLSGGQQQRAALARSIAYNPDVLLLDEPFSALDYHLKGEVQAEMLELLKLYNGEVLIVTHSIDEAYKFCKNLVVIDKGNSVLFGNTREIIKDPKLISAARLTGCNNISRCCFTASNKIYARDWDLEITINKKATDIDYVGIHSNSFDIVESKNSENIMECEIVEIIEKVHGYTVIFHNKSGNINAANMYYDVKKEEWDNRNNKTNLFLKIRDDSILLLI
ncbi:MAG: sulfate/molybdate ABC transporter ATP-binding protein [Sedimentibacter sp.]